MIAGMLHDLPAITQPPKRTDQSEGLIGFIENEAARKFREACKGSRLSNRLAFSEVFQQASRLAKTPGATYTHCFCRQTRYHGMELVNMVM